MRTTVTTLLEVAGILLLIAAVGVALGEVCLWLGLGAAGGLALIASALVELRRPRLSERETT